MSIYENVNNIKLLQNLLKSPDEQQSSDSEDEHLPGTGMYKFGKEPVFCVLQLIYKTIRFDETISFQGPGDIKPTHRSTIQCNTSAKNTRIDSTASPTSVCAPKNETHSTTTPKSIEEWQDLHEQQDLDALDTRPRPDYQIAYKQNVSTEDVFLQMGCKTGATSSCDEMVITIDMPAETVGIERMELAVTANGIDLQSPVYRLKMPLPHRINPDAGSAKYDALAHRMTLRLKMVREFDYVNF